MVLDDDCHSLTWVSRRSADKGRGSVRLRGAGGSRLRQRTKDYRAEDGTLYKVTLFRATVAILFLVVTGVLLCIFGQSAWELTVVFAGVGVATVALFKRV